ncbi:LLM class F420-dependent oxidoreductase [Actinomadura madurae]|uniref:Probable F420-dependent oxidoreductase, Rv1855c family n=1 Tax=Actinomadura madurae TaxID=1993 RepID=A0A1I4WPL3_9ACTN|nr:LLM class F420-dependent oxidoreductase [Actinomadura madurae]MCP9954657.1 LLM class F420-dependent oxidoreductase [Actinomadura madurae]MCP9971391.1 LLM class F420-dependent oxidoreductase [Actinomadura madurae]MCP9983880.1 LLM class F420-dependent oxidoreductase [Actinomadura madurae]MCQ0004549.1 LLM class F420-dependent oxidoreductase [Actinomadura madurae]MCQ0020117.1 LLM class F420-dependent oxidoreductase [Actinomadura madurae]
MRVGLQIPSFTHPGGPEEIAPAFGRMAREADQGGLHSLWVMDHFFQIRGVGPSEDPMLEGYTALAYAAALTERITLGTMVTGVTYREPGILVKTVTTLDVLSGGRAWLGIGAAWNEEESRGLGVAFPPTAERFERLEETLRIARQMWEGDEAPFEGEHYRLERPLNSPPALRRPHPPILIGGGGEKKTLRFVAKYADACNLFDGDELPHKLDVLREHCEREGRDYGEIEKTALTLLEGTPSADQAADTIGRLAERGIDHAIFSQRTGQDLAPVLAEALTRTEKIVPAGR